MIVNESLFSRQRRLFIKNFRYNFRHLLNCIITAEDLNSDILKDQSQNCIFYSYWFFDWNLALSILFKKKKIKRHCTRAHGFDLYENNGKENYLPFRLFCLKNTNKVFTVSRKGASYLKELYPLFSSKIECSYLGTNNHGLGPLPEETGVLQIVSCSSLVPVKRVELIIETLRHCNNPVYWTHIGGGPLKSELESKCSNLPKNIKTNFVGNLSHEELFQFYQAKAFDLFVNCSISEGLPVSIMEAISFGVPILATNVGGTGEIVNEITGYLISADFKPDELAKSLYVYSKEKRTLISRSKIRTFWLSNFSADRNYRDFFEALKTL